MGNCCASCYRGATLSKSLVTADTESHTVGRSRDGLYEPALADSEREAVADLLQYLENVRDRIRLLVHFETDS